MTEPRHGFLTVSNGIHSPHQWEYADATARAAATGFVATDVKKLALQLDDFSHWVLTDDSPVTWARVGAGSEDYKVKLTSGDLSPDYLANKVGGSLVNAGTAIKLASDSDTPGNYYAYMTDGAGAKGWRQIDHTWLGSKGTNTHATIDTHLASTSNPHNTTYSQVGADAAGSAATVQGNLNTHIGLTASVHNFDASGDAPPQAHVLDGAKHTVSGLTTGYFLKATGATTFGFAAHGLTYSDVGAAASSHTHAATDVTSGTLDGDRLPGLSATKKGGVPMTGTPSGLFLKDDGTWATPPGAPAGSNTYIQFNDGGAMGGASGFLYSKTLGLVGIGTTPTSRLAVRSQSDSPTLGSELTASSGWTSTDWTGDYDVGFTHTTGNTTSLSRAGTSGSAGVIYRIAFTISGRTAGGVTCTFAGMNSGAYYTNGTKDFSLRGDSAGAITFIPTSDFDGTISAISVKQMTAAITPTEELYDTSGNLVWGIRAVGGDNANYPNVYMGKTSGSYTTAGYANVGIGNRALASVTIGNQNTAVGNQALATVSIATGNSAFGNGALAGCSMGGSNTGLGYYAGWNILSGGRNTCVGWGALGGATATATVQGSIAIGYGSSASLASGTGTTVIGSYAFANHTSGDYNTIIGQEAGRNAVAGRTGASHNVAVGYQALYALESSQTGAIGVGYKAGLTSTSNNNIFLGKEADIVSTQRSNAVAIGYQAKVDQDNSLILGVVGATSYLVGIGTTQPGAQFHTVCRSATTVGQIIQAASAQTANLHCWRDSSSNILARIDANGNLSLGDVSPGTSGLKILTVGTGTAPGSSPADAYQTYSKDENGAAGKACWHERTESGTEVWHGEGARGLRFWITPEGGYAVKLVAGEALNASEVVYIKEASGADGKVWKNPVDGDMPIGVVYASASADADVWVVTTGIVAVLPTSSITAARGQQLYSSASEAGRVDQTNSPSTPTHWREVGHWLDTGSGNGAATRALIHFN